PRVELTAGLVGAAAALLPRRERRLVARAQVLERRALGRDRAAGIGVEQRRLELLLHAAVALRDRVTVAHGGDQLDRAHLLVARTDGAVGREVEDLPVRVGQAPERVAAPLLERRQLLLELLPGALHLLVVALAQGAQRVLVALRLAAALEAPRAPDPLVLHLGADRKSTRLNSSHQITSYA